MEEAEQVLVQGLVVHPTLSGAHVLLAKMREAAGDPAGAMEACRNLASLDPHNRALPDLLQRLKVAPVSEAASALAAPAAPEPTAAPEADPTPTVASETGSTEPAAPQDLDFFEPFVIAPERAASAQAVSEPSTPPAPPAPIVPPAPAPIPEATVPGNVPQTRTLAELYVSQGHTARAIAVYEALSAQRPEDQELIRRLAELRGEPAPVMAAAAPPPLPARPAQPAPAATQARPAASPFDGVEGLEDFSLWLETLPVLPEVTHGRRVS